MTSLVVFQGRFVLLLKVYPQDEHRFSIHTWLSNNLDATAVTKVSSNGEDRSSLPSGDCLSSPGGRHHPCLHHSAKGVHVRHLPRRTGHAGGVKLMKIELDMETLGWTFDAANRSQLLRSCLNVDVYNHVLNTHDEDSMNLCGSCVVPLAMFGWTVNNNKAITADVYVPGERAHQMTRGSFTCPAFENEAPRVLVDGRGWQVRMTENQATKLITEIMQPDVQLVLGPMQRWKAVFDKLAPRYQCMRGINAFYYDARLCRLPMYAYICRRVPLDGAEFFEYTLKAVLDRLGHTEQEFLSVDITTSPWVTGSIIGPVGCVGKQVPRSALPERVLTEVLGSVIHCMPYLMDQNARGLDPDGHMHRINIESFDFCRALLKLDCEDGAMEAIMEFMSLVQLDGSLSPALAHLVKVARMYVPFLWLVGVSSMEINEEKMGNVRNMGAHMHAAFVPWNQWIHWSRNDPNAKARPAWATDEAVRNSAFAPGVLLVEGTGYLDGSGDDPTLGDRQLVYNVVSTQLPSKWDRARKEFGFVRGGPSQFYKLLVVAYSPVWAEYGQCGFVPMIEGDKSHYGLRFQDINVLQQEESRWRNICFRALPSLNADEIVLVHQAANQHYPLSSLSKPTCPETFYAACQQPATEMVHKLAKLLIKSSKSRREYSGPVRRVPVRWFISYSNMNNSTISSLSDALDAVATGAPMEYRYTAGAKQSAFTAWIVNYSLKRQDVMDGLGTYQLELMIELRDDVK